MGKKKRRSILPFRHDFRVDWRREAKRRRKRGNIPKGAETPPLFHVGMENEGREREGARPFIKGWVWAPPQLKLVGIKTSIYGPRMRLKKKGKMFLIKSSFHKV